MEGKTPPAQVAQCQDHLGHKCIGAGCSDQMQLAQGQDLHHLNANMLVVFFLLATSANTPLALMVVIATCAGGVFPQSTSAFTDAHIATCTEPECPNIILYYIILFTLPW